MASAGYPSSRGLAGARLPRDTHPESWAAQLPWYVSAVLLGFVVPYLGSSLLKLQHDVYLAAYFVAVLGLFGAYARATNLDVAQPCAAAGSSASCSG